MDEIELRPGMCAGFPAGGAAHHLANRTDADVVILEIGDRTPGDEGSYPNDDIEAVMTPNGTGASRTRMADRIEFRLKRIERF